MVTLQTIGGRYNQNILEIYGLSSDVKPIVQVEGQTIVNGSIFYCIDTKQAFIFDEQNKVWIEQ